MCFRRQLQAWVVTSSSDQLAISQRFPWLPPWFWLICSWNSEIALVPFYPQRIWSKTRSECLKTQMVANLLYTVFFLYTHTTMRKFDLQIRHSQRLTTIANNTIEQLQQYAVIQVKWMCLSLWISSGTVPTLLAMMWGDKMPSWRHEVGQMI